MATVICACACACVSAYPQHMVNKTLADRM